MTETEKEKISKDDIEAKRLLGLIRELEKKLHRKPMGICERCINQMCHIGQAKLREAKYSFPAVNSCANFHVDFPKREQKEEV